MSCSLLRPMGMHWGPGDLPPPPGPENTSRSLKPEPSPLVQPVTFLAVCLWRSLLPFYIHDQLSYSSRWETGFEHKSIRRREKTWQGVAEQHQSAWRLVKWLALLQIKSPVAVESRPLKGNQASPIYSLIQWIKLSLSRGAVQSWLFPKASCFVAGSCLHLRSGLTWAGVCSSLILGQLHLLPLFEKFLNGSISGGNYLSLIFLTQRCTYSGTRKFLHACFQNQFPS